MGAPHASEDEETRVWKLAAQIMGFASRKAMSDHVKETKAWGGVKVPRGAVVEYSRLAAEADALLCGHRQLRKRTPGCSGARL